MSALYVHCPECRFPAVIHATERSLRRYCRQCKCVFVPLEPEPEPSVSHEPTPAANISTVRAVFRALLRKRRRPQTV